MGLFNFPEVELVDGRKAVLTRFEFPMWCRKIALGSAVRSFKVRDIEVGEISSKFELPSIKLEELGEARDITDKIMSKLKGWLHPQDVYSYVTELHPVDGVEFVEWMHISMAENLTMRARIAEYNSSPNSYATGSANDPRFPGLVVDDSRINSDSGSVVRS
ncbi:MAG: hypothetical protein QXD29_00830, partial [Thermoplasmata archaeon]